MGVGWFPAVRRCSHTAPPDHPLILLPGHWESSHPCGTPVIERLKKTVEVKSTLHGADSLSPFAELPSKAEGRKLLQDKE